MVAIEKPGVMAQEHGERWSMFNGDSAEVLGNARGAGADGGNVRLWGLAGIGGLG